MAILALIVGLTYCQFATKPLPLSLETSLIAVFFIVSGDFYMKVKEKINRQIGKYRWLVLVSIAISVILNFDKVEMYSMSYGNWFLFLTGSIFSILLVCFFCSGFLCSNKFWSIIMEYGRLSLLVFAIHYYFLFVPITLKNRLLSHSCLGQEYIYWIASAFVCLIFVLPISNLINSKVKWLVGK